MENSKRHIEKELKIAELLGPERAIVLDKKEWTEDVSHINKVIEWLGFSPTCEFKELLEYNTRGYSATKTKTAPFPSSCVAIDD